MTTTKEQVITDKVALADDTMEAVVLEGSAVRIYLKSGNIIENKILDDVHAQIRYEECLKALKSSAGYNAVTEVDDMSDYLTEIAKESKTEESSSED